MYAQQGCCCYSDYIAVVMSAAIVVFITAAIVVFFLIADLLCTYIETQHIHIVIVVIDFLFHMSFLYLQTPATCR